MPRSQAIGDILENLDPVLHEPEKLRIPGKPVAVRDTTAQDDRTQRKHDQAYVIAVTDPEPHTEGDRRATHLPRSTERYGRVHRVTHKTRRRVSQRAGKTLA